MTNSPTETPNKYHNFWNNTLQSVAAWGIIGGVAGIGYLTIQVPRSLDVLLLQQHTLTERTTAIEARLKNIEDRLIVVDARVQSLEERTH